MKKIGVWTAVIALLAGVLTGCGSGGSASNEYIEIKQYDGLEIDKVDESKVTDEDVEQEIQTQLEAMSENKTEVPDRPIKKGDTIVVDCSAKDKDGKVLDGTQLQDYELEIGSGSFIAGWEDACIGKPYGKEFTFDLKFPAEYRDDLAGKNATWTVTAKGMVAGKKEAKLTDDTVKKLSDTAKTVDEYKAEVKKTLQENQESSNRQLLESEVWEALMKQTKVKEYPKERLDKEVDKALKSYQELAAQYQMSYEDFLAQSGMTEKELEKQVKSQAKEDLKRDLATELLLDELDLKMSKDEYTEKYKELAKLYGYGKEYKQFIQAAGKDLAKKIAEQSTVAAWLVDHAKQVEPKDETTDGASGQEDKAMGDSQK